MFCLRERPIISGFLESVRLLIPLYLPIRVKLSKVWGFPLFARAVACLGFSYCFAHSLSNALLLANTKH